MFRGCRQSFMVGNSDSGLGNKMYCVTARRFMKLVIALVLPWLGGCMQHDTQTRSAPTERATLGELAYALVDYNMAVREELTCQEARLQTMTEHRDIFVESVDTIAPDTLLLDISKFTTSCLLPAVDSGDAQRALDVIDASLARVLDASNNTSSRTLEALLSIARSQSLVRDDEIVRLMDRLVQDEGIETSLRALAGLAVEHDGVDYVSHSALDLVSRILDRFAEPAACSGLTLGQIESTLLREDTSASAAMGDTVWAPYGDANGHPRVQLNATGQVLEPFVDLNSDGLIDTDAFNRPVDANGIVIEQRPVGFGTGYDAEGRALSRNGELLYDYYDVRRTGLSYLSILLYEALDRELHHHLSEFIHRSQPTIEVCQDGTTTCRKFADDENTLAELAYLLLEIARFEDAQSFLKTWADLIRNNPELAEDVIVAIGQTIEALDGSGIDVEDDNLYVIAEKILPMLDQVFESPNNGSLSTARTLLNTVHGLGQIARDLPQQLLFAIDYRELGKEQTCSDEYPKAELSTPVDYASPRYITQSGGASTDNRSSLEQSIELLSTVDCGSVPFTGGKTVAEVVLDVVSGMNPSTVCGVIDVSLGVINAAPNISEFFTEIALNTLGCPGEEVFRSLQALDGLAKSGALDAYIPLAKVFNDQNQLRLLIDIFHLVSDDLRLDEDNDVATQSVIRKALPVLQKLLRSGSVDKLLDLLDLLVETPSIDNNGSAADVIVDSIERVVNDDSTVMTRQGPREMSSLGLELVYSVRTMMSNVSTHGGSAALEELWIHVTSYVRETEVDDSGTVDPSDDRIVLSNRRFIPLTTVVLDLLTDVVSLEPDARTCYFDAIQSELDSVLTGREFATLMRLVQSLANSSNGEILEAWVGNILSPLPTLTDSNGEALDVHAELISLVAGLLQAPIEGTDIDEFLVLGSDLLDPEAIELRDLILAFDTLLESDEADQLQVLLRNMTFNPEGLDQPPLLGLIDIASAVAELDTASQCTPRVAWSADDLRDFMQTLYGYVSNQDSGLPAIIRILELRQRPQN